MHRNLSLQVVSRGCRGRHRMVIGSITTYVISAYHHYTIATNVVSSNPVHGAVRCILYNFWW